MNQAVAEHVEQHQVGIPRQNLLENDVYQQFLSDDFNVTAYTSNVLKISSIQTSLEKLTMGKKDITQELNDSITGNYQHLFNQASNIKDFDKETEALKQGLLSLEQSIMRMRKEISEPYMNIKSQITQLRRVQDTCEMLRVVIRYLSLVKKLKIHLKEDTLRKESNLTGIAIIDTQVQWVNQCREQIITTASNLLLQSMDNQNQSEVASALQVFYNLGILVDRVNSVVNATTERLTKSIKAMLNVNKLVGNQQTVERIDQSIWSKIESVTDSLYTSCIQIWQLQRVLTKIRDPLTNKSLMDIIKTTGGQDNISHAFWKNATKVLETNLTVAAKSSNVIENTFILEYPKISRYFYDFSRRLQNYCDLQQGVVGISLDDHQLLFKTISMFEKGYLERSRHNMLSIMNVMFPQSAWGRGSSPSSVPTSKQMVDLSKSIWAEIEVIESDKVLVNKVTKVVSAVIELFATKMEAMIQQGQQACEIIIDNKPTSGQIINCSLFNSATHLQNSLQSLLSSHSLPTTTAELLDKSIMLLSGICTNILTPLITTFLQGAEQIVSTIHFEDWSNDNNISSTKQCSSFMDNLQQYVFHFNSNFLSKFTPCPILAQQCKHLVSRLFTLFIRHASLLKPMNEKGKLRLANDLTHLELSVTPLIPEGIKEVGQPYHWVRTFKHFIFKDLTQQSTLKGLTEMHSMPAIIMAHCLIARGPKEMIFPHVFTNWSTQQYVRWMEEHTETEALHLVRMALDAYTQTINKRGEKEFSYLYPLLHDLITINGVK
ncbi:hypothetical protein SAMD00019534_090640 [Acytostelium subglobosum LB1]|uniref:hypothetical protein n=1 Tax=Acytostelium subglobosum LB1 TaxID=1410327 RepID=UPI0006449F47|nr:hypothetical protein SAMD00019534_090640 [Acytostelium subglobosum LB1]GAM25889.1 hypothetical protein SAMD00019534_090640 [Acytostelium subglobosum LB1]|eukprot:XP_012750932.1 hypothetical protein SAMD00019534_090640 [Acytostelium subglobosum LB1]